MVQAVADVSFDIQRGETLALVGESGCGKSTLGRLLLRLIQSTSGTISFDGRNLTGMITAEMGKTFLADTFDELQHKVAVSSCTLCGKGGGGGSPCLGRRVPQWICDSSSSRV